MLSLYKITLKVASISWSRPTEKRTKPGDIPIDNCTSSGTSLLVDLPELLNKVLK